MANQLHIVGVQFSTFVRSVQFCCEEIGLEYTLGSRLGEEEYPLRSEILSKLHPFCKVPVLVMNDKVLYEAQSICRFLDGQYNQSRLQPDNSWQKAQVDQWCAAVSDYVYRAVVKNYLLEYLFPKGDGNTVRRDVVVAAMPEVLAIVQILEKQLGEREFLVCDQFSLADIMLTPILHYLITAPDNQDLIRRDSALRNYVQRIMARPAAEKVFS